MTPPPPIPPLEGRRCRNKKKGAPAWFYWRELRKRPTVFCCRLGRVPNPSPRLWCYLSSLWFFLPSVSLVEPCLSWREMSRKGPNKTTAKNCGPPPLVLINPSSKEFLMVPPPLVGPHRCLSKKTGVCEDDSSTTNTFSQELLSLTFQGMEVKIPPVLKQCDKFRFLIV
jgi:hypothetical protein